MAETEATSTAEHFFKTKAAILKTRKAVTRSNRPFFNSVEGHNRYHHLISAHHLQQTSYCYFKLPSMASTYWSHPSVKRFAGDKDPVALIMSRAREVVLEAIENGWKGPPFDPTQLAQILKIMVVPQSQVAEARLVPTGNRFTIEFNPFKPKSRIRYSIAHEIAHTLFEDCGEAVRYRKAEPSRTDEWQLEVLCNLAAAEFLMPIGSFINNDLSRISIENVLSWRKDFQVSMEAMLLRTLNLTNNDQSVFGASTQDGRTYHLDYVLTKQGPLRQLYGSVLAKDSSIRNCTAIGFTEKGHERWPAGIGDVAFECVGVNPYPGSVFPRVVGLLKSKSSATEPQLLKEVQGDALAPRGGGPRILAHIVSDAARTWGAGFGKQVATKYPDAARKFKSKIENGYKLRLGDVFSTEVEEGLTIVQLIAQKGYGESTKPRIRYVALQTCLQKLGELASANGATVHMPPIGTGHAGGSWQLVRELVDQQLCQRGIFVTVYNLEGQKGTTPPQLSLFG